MKLSLSPGSFNELEFYRFILDNDLFRFGETVLASGRKSCFKLDWEPALTKLRTLDYVARSVLAKVNDLGLEPDLFIGVPEGVTSLGVAIQLLWAEKTGLDNLVISRKNEGYVGNPAHQQIVYIEDTATTGGSIVRELEKAVKHQAWPTVVISLADRKQLTDSGKTVREVVESQGMAYHNLSSVPRLLVGAYAKGLIPEDPARMIEAEYAHLQEGWLLGTEKPLWSGIVD